MQILSYLVSLAGQAFFSGLWQGTVLVLGITLVFRLQPRISPSTRFLVSSCAFVLAAFLPLFHARHLDSVASTSASTPLHLAPVFACAIAAVWLSMTAIRVVRLLYQGLRIRHIWAAATPVAVEAETAAILHTLGRRARLCTSDAIDSPCIIGFFSPRLLVPAALMPQISAADLHQIVLHECTHLHRYDDWLNLAQKVGLALFPLNPALLWIDRRLGLERELACDAAVVARTSAPFDYAHCLTRLAEHRLCSRRLSLALSAWGRRSELLRRVQQLLRPAAAISPLQARASFAMMGVALIAGSVAMVRVPRLVSFSAPAETPSALAANASPLPAGAGMVPVVYRESFPAHATLLRYRPKEGVSASRPVLQTATELQTTTRIPTQRRAARLPHPASRLVLTSATTRIPPMTFHNAQADRQVRSVYLISVEISPSYAALPYGNGWLIIQL